MHSEQGSILIIPREGGYLVRLYIELDNERDAEKLRDRSATPERLTEVANRILHPYTLEVKHVGWWAVYEIGQRHCEGFDDVPDAAAGTRLPRVFIAGDACHTHSAKAGQGMNVSMADAADGDDADVAEFQSYFRAQGRFTAGVAVRYEPSILTATHQHLAEGFGLGMRFHSAPVVRLADAKPMHLGHAARADGAWRLYAFADRAHPAGPGSLLGRLCEFLASDKSPLARFTPPGAEPDSVIDVRAVL